MIKYDTTYLQNFVSVKELMELGDKVRKASVTLREGNGAGNDKLGWRDLPADFDKEEYARIKEAAKRIREQSDILVVIGIGGSYLGARAVLEMIKGQLYNDFAGLKVYFAGNAVSGDDLDDVLKLCDRGDVSVNVISKSGTTTEPAVAFRIFRNYLVNRYGAEEAAKRIYATTDKVRGTLKKLSQEMGFETFVVPDEVGGRYSVLTPVGLLPLAAAGVDTDALLAGAEAMRSRSCGCDTLDDPCNLYAAVRHWMYTHGKKLELMTCFEPRFRMMGEWYKQLFGESQGKAHKGLFPDCCIYTTDLHSMGQYVQDGERMLFETLVRFEDTPSCRVIDNDLANYDGLNYIAGREMKYVNKVASEATLMAHVAGGVPCSVISCEKMDEFNLGELIYFFERACAVSGYMLGTNPFDQPGVEDYKRNMFALLDRPGYESVKEELLKNRI